MSTSQKRSNSYRRLIALTIWLLTFVVFALFATQILNLFFGPGAYWLDAGWYSWMMSRPSLWPENPPSMHSFSPDFYSVHFSPFLPLWGLFASLLELNHIWAMAAFQGALHAGLFLASYMLAREAIARMADRAALAFPLAIAAGLLAAFNPITLDAIGYPHYELMLPALFLISATLWIKGHGLLAAVFFFLMLLVREDSGFHAACFLWSYTILARWQAKRWQKDTKVAFWAGTIGFIYSTLVIFSEALLFPGPSAFMLVYAGEPFFDHLNFSLIMQRLWSLAELRPELYILFAFPFLAFLAGKDLRHLAGAVGALPWTALQICAVRDQPATLTLYYPFPLILVFLWPLIVGALPGGSARARLRSGSGKALVAAFLSVVLGFALYYSTPLSTDRSLPIARQAALGGFVPRITFDQYRNTLLLIDAIESAIGRGDRILLDSPGLSLVPGAAEESNVFDSHLTQAGVGYLIVYNRDYFGSVDVVNAPLAKYATHCATLAATTWAMVGTLDPVAVMPLLERHLDLPAACGEPAAAPGGWVFTGAALPGKVGWTEGSGRTAAADRAPAGHLTYGPYVDLAQGRYAVTIAFSATAAGHSWDAVHSGGSRAVAAGAFADTSGERRELTVQIDAADPLPAFEFRTHFGGSGALSVWELRIERLR